MIFQEPQVEFVPIRMDEVLTTSPLTSSYETCNGKLAASNNCLADDVRWANNSESPNCVGVYVSSIDDWDY